MGPVSASAAWGKTMPTGIRFTPCIRRPTTIVIAHAMRVRYPSTRRDYAERMPSLREVVAALDALYRPEWADEWDAVGTVVGDPEAEVTRILLAVDPVQAVVDQAIA